MMTPRIPHSTYHGVVINRAKFDVCSSSSFREFKTDRHTDRIALCILHNIRSNRSVDLVIENPTRGVHETFNKAIKSLLQFYAT